MKQLTKLSIAATSAAFALTATRQAASAASFNFFQGGYSEGASITGMFTGEDLDNDGAIASFADEVTDYMVSFSGNSRVPAFSHSFPNLAGLIYFLGSDIGDFFDIDGILSADGTTSYGTSAGSEFFFPGGNVETLAGAFDVTQEFVTVTPKGVPEPNAALGLGMLGLGAFYKRKLNQKQHNGKA